MQIGLKQVLSRFMFWVHDFTMGLYLDTPPIFSNRYFLLIKFKYLHDRIILLWSCFFGSFILCWLFPFISHFFCSDFDHYRISLSFSQGGPCTILYLRICIAVEGRTPVRDFHRVSLRESFRPPPTPNNLTGTRSQISVPISSFRSPLPRGCCVEMGFSGRRLQLSRSPAHAPSSPPVIWGPWFSKTGC